MNIKLKKRKRITIHEFRHSHASILISDDMNLLEVSRRLGHSNTSITSNIYAHAVKKKDDKIANYLDKHCQNLAIK